MVSLSPMSIPDAFKGTVCPWSKIRGKTEEGVGVGEGEGGVGCRVEDGGVGCRVEDWVGRRGGEGRGGWWAGREGGGTATASRKGGGKEKGVPYLFIP